MKNKLWYYSPYIPIIGIITILLSVFIRKETCIKDFRHFIGTLFVDWAVIIIFMFILFPLKQKPNVYIHTCDDVFLAVDKGDNVITEDYELIPLLDSMTKEGYTIKIGDYTITK